MTPAEKLIHYNVTETRCERMTLTLPANCAGLRLDRALQRLLPKYSRNRLQIWIHNNLVTLDGETVSAKQKVWGGEKVNVLINETDSGSMHGPEAIALDIIYEDDALLVVNKPAGLVVHPGNGNRTGTMLNALLHHQPNLEHIPRAGIVHRLDKNTSGLLVVAKTLSAQSNLVRQFQMRTIKREYLAVVHGKVTGDGKVDAAIGRHPVDRVKMAVVAKGKPAITHYRVEQRLTHFTLLRCNLESGRTHQIRVHMQTIKHPILGDPVYGSKLANKKHSPEVTGFPRQALHATRLELTHPITGMTLSWAIKLPEDMTALLGLLKKTG